MDKYERTINLLSTYVKRWKELFDRYCELISDKSITDNQKRKEGVGHADPPPCFSMTDLQTNL